MKFILLILLTLSCSSKELCSSDLRDIAEEDQSDRKNFFKMSEEELSDLSYRDAERRNKVSEFSRMGCLNTAEDFKNAALVFQHGSEPHDFYRSFEWSKKGIALGDISQRSMLAMALDRYLVKSGMKQLFGTQATKDSGSPCWCLEPYEEKFSEATRVLYTGKSIAEQSKWVTDLNAGQDCKILSCNHSLKAVPEEYIREKW
ncbi:MAG: hypothetical protein V4598_06980 [Bdellovibrionota bacterium]